MFRPSHIAPSGLEPRSASHPSGGDFGVPIENHEMALLALSHTRLEDRLYRGGKPPPVLGSPG
jgi:hypothetical protein